MQLGEIAHFCAHGQYGRARVSAETFRSYRIAVARLVEYFGDVEVESLTTSDMLDWQEWLDNRDASSVTTDNSYKRTIRAIWNLLRSRGVQVCDTDGIWRFRKQARGVKSISQRNYYRMAAFSGIRETLMLILANQSARRRGGLARLQVTDLHFITHDNGREGVVGHTIEKGDKPQLLLADEEAVWALKLWLDIRENFLKHHKVDDHGYLFINLMDGSPLSEQAMSQAIWRLKERAGIPADQPASLHAQRHYRAKELLKALSLPEVRDILGHEDASTTANMYAVNGEQELIDAFFKRAGGGE